MNRPTCRSCTAPLSTVFVDLGSSPLSNNYVPRDGLDAPEPKYPLKPYVCGRCFLVQVEEFETPAEIFSDYAYFSSIASSWVEHARRYAEMATRRFSLDHRSRVVEIASNDGYLLQFFVAKGIPVLGIEPAETVAAAARERGVDTLVRFFGAELARELAAEGRRADLIVANNVLAHVPDLNGFIEGVRTLLKPEGTATFEFPHLLRLLEGNQFDTIYHEHFSYFSLLVVSHAMARNGLRVWDVEELPTHGGSLRVYVGHIDGPHGTTERVAALLERERAAGLDRLETYADFGARVETIREDLRRFLVDAKAAGKKVAGYGAPAKATTLLNYCAVGPDLLPFVVDRSPHKQDHYIPGVRIPILAPAALADHRPDYVLILPWNLKDEIVHDMREIRSWGGRFAVAIPRVEVLP